jgi:hypothetical protein
MTPKEYKQMDDEYKDLAAEKEMAWDLAMNDGGSALRRNERNWAKFYEKWYGVNPDHWKLSKTQKTLDSFKRKTKKVTKTKRKVK